MVPRITSDPDICNGRPVIRGTRITVQSVLEFLGAGDSVDEVLAGFPALTRDDILACLRFAADLLAGIEDRRREMNRPFMVRPLQ